MEKIHKLKKVQVVFSSDEDKKFKIYQKNHPDDHLFTIKDNLIYSEFDHTTLYKVDYGDIMKYFTIDNETKRIYHNCDEKYPKVESPVMFYIHYNNDHSWNTCGYLAQSCNFCLECGMKLPAFREIAEKWKNEI